MIDFNTLAYKCVYASIDQQTCTQYTYTFHRPNFSIFNIYSLSVHAVNRRVLSPRQYKFHLLLHTLLWLAAVLAAMPLCLPIACCFHARQIRWSATTKLLENCYESLAHHILLEGCSNYHAHLLATEKNRLLMDRWIVERYIPIPIVNRTNPRGADKLPATCGCRSLNLPC